MKWMRHVASVGGDKMYRIYHFSRKAGKNRDLPFQKLKSNRKKPKTKN